MGGIEHWTQDIHTGDAVELLRQMPESSVHMAMCSPPYWGLRDYSAEGQIGLEPTLADYIESIVEVGQELRRVIRPDGSWWLNLGDTFAGGGGVAGKPDDWDDIHEDDAYPGEPPARDTDFRRKTKLFVPHRVAIALHDVGWMGRADGVWAKPNSTPHPVKDRVVENKEFLFHLVPYPDYWWDLDAIREPHAQSSIKRSGRHDHERRDYPGGTPQTLDPDEFVHPRGKNPGDIFEVVNTAFPDAHFAVYPPDLCKKPIKSSCPPEVCGDCGAPYERVTEQVPIWEVDKSTIDREQSRRALELAEAAGLTDEHMAAARAVGLGNMDQSEGNPYDRVDDETERLAREVADELGSYYREFLMSKTEITDEWRQQCECDTMETEPGIVLDPFAGAGTTCLVAKELGRQFIGLEINPEYVAMAQRRVGITIDRPELLADDGQTTVRQWLD